MKTRLNYVGGTQQRDRMIEDKLKALKKAMNYSYQAATAELADGRQFKCLINPDKLKIDYDNKIISIPFEDICLNQPKVGKTIEGIQEIGMKAGDVFTWVETQTDWIVYLQHLEEAAYFRASIRRCQYEVEVNGKKYKVYVKGPDNNRVEWHTKHKENWNDIDYLISMYITKNEETEQFFHRFMKIKVNDKPYEVQVVDNLTNDGILEVKLMETYQNSMAEAAAAEAGIDYTVIRSLDDEIEPEQQQEEEFNIIEPAAIIGKNKVYPYDQLQYTIENADNGTWEVDNKKAIITKQTSQYANVTIATGRSGEVNLIYKRDGENDIIFNIQIQSF